MPNPARSGDIAMGVCPAHKTPQNWTAVWVSTSTVQADGKPKVNMTHIAVCSCGHNVVPVTGSSTIMIEGSPSHRIGDSCKNFGMGVTMQGSPTVVTG